MMMATSYTVAECWFVDVGQGTSNIILLGDERAVLIDTGPADSRATMSLLRRHVKTIEALIISHNDKDHDGGTANVLAAYPKAVKRMVFLADRGFDRMVKTLELVEHERIAGNLLQDPERLEYAGSAPLFKDNKTGITLRVFYPSFLENVTAEAAGTRRPNTTSAVLALSCGEKRIIYGGDTQKEGWEAIERRYAAELPLHCDILAVPHHGGHIVEQDPQGTYTAEAKFLDSLYGSVLQPHVAVISVGSSNQHGHPLQSVVSSLVKAGARVCCTQMTQQCCDDLEQVRPGLVRQTEYGRSSRTESRTSHAQRSRDVGCFSTVIAEISPTSVRISGLAEHQQAVSDRSSDAQFHPLCR